MRNDVVPVALVSVADRALVAVVQQQLHVSGWHILAEHVGSDTPSMLICDHSAAFEDAGLAGRVLLGDTNDDPCDDVLPLPFSTAQLARVITYWDPRETIAGATRLAALFGDKAIAASLRGLRDQLADALVDPNTSRAHRLAGVAGTLGFPDASAAWLAVSEDVPNALSGALHEARRVIVAIDSALSDCR